MSQFLIGLNEQFTATRSQILLIHLLPDLTCVYSMLLQEENYREFSQQTTTGVNIENFAMNVQFSSNNLGNKTKTVKKASDSSIACDHCKLTGHSKDKYFVLHGYPE